MAGAGVEHIGHTGGGGVCAVCCAESVVHEHVGVAGELLGESRVVGFLLGVVADIFQKQQATVLQLGCGILGRLANALVAEGNRLAGQLGEFVGDRAEAHRWHALAFRAAKVRGEDDFRAVLDHQLECRQGGADAGVVVDDHRAVLLGHGHVVVDAGQHAFALQIDVVDG